ncbi:cytochrome b [Pseudoalteromonas sp. MMG013]|uniref:cytochrome b n=1 Tax=Pseudoalteromonas sp. MMG013 TaxID=2822687 RepID=UPI001B3883D1|nr:cytochrome b/b6 domain-containing protein [Pseudoalteromonas sp. MMG013]MBQ4861555.1 cytochrome b [Pseudoalteromonas sp. MMG013]
MTSYSWSYKLLHWLSAVLIILMCFALVGFNPQMSDADRSVMLIGHSSIGTFITLLIMIRLFKRFILKHKQPKHEQPPTFVTIAQLTHYALYALMVLVPLTGYITANFHQLPVQLFASIALNGSHDTNLFNTARFVHASCVKALIALVILHIAGVLRHKFILKDNTLYKMRPWFANK